MEGGARANRSDVQNVRPAKMQHVFWMIQDQPASRCGPDRMPWNLLDLRAAGSGAVRPIAYTAEGWSHLVFEVLTAAGTNESFKPNPLRGAA